MAGQSDGSRAIDQGKLEAFLGKVVGDLGAGMSCALALIGDQLGLYEAMAGAGPLTASELAQKTRLSERYVREWLLNQAAGEYVTFDSATQRFELPPEHAVALTDDQSPACIAGGFEVIAALMNAQPRIREAFRTGEGMPWGDHEAGLFSGTERFFRAGYLGHLMVDWLPSIEGAAARLEKGGRVADVGCGHGASTILMAQSFPKAKFHGYDNHEPSIERARAAAREAGVADRTTFEISKASEIPHRDGGYDLVAFFDCVHDMGDPVSALRRAKETLAPGGAIMMVEPLAGERVEDNLNPVGRLFSAASVLCCTPNALATGGRALGTCASDSALAEVAREAGLARFRRAATTPFNRVFEARA